VRHPNGKLAGARVRDVLSDEMLEVRAKRILAAAGPWADAIRQLDDAAAPPLLRLTKGVHITVSAPRLPLSHAVVIRGRDGRMMFAIPRGVHTYVGTTDTDFNDDPTTVTADAEDVEYILDAANRTFPQARLGAGEVTSTWAGLRPLIRPGDTADPSAVSRDYDIFHSPSGLVSIGGGKLTAFRAMASHIVDELFPGSRTPASLGASLGPLPGFSGRLPTAADFERLAARTGARPAEVQRWGARYGSALEQVAAELSPTTSGDPAADWSRAMTRHAVRAEMAQRLEDVWSRRTDLMLFSDTNGRQLIEPLGAEMAELLGWSSARLEQEKQRVAAGIDSMFRWRDAFDTKKGGAVLTTVSTDSQGSPVPGLPRP
jgi:glycerol-3-phosphate dehydrogenase